MDKRGRKSAAELSVIKPSSISAITRPVPPKELTNEQKQEWLAVTNRMPADWFPRETHAMLSQYCRHVVSAHRIAMLIEKVVSGDYPDEWLHDWDRLLKMQEREGRALSLLATRLRMTQQSRISAHRKVSTTATPKPWELKNE
jgi:chaperone required for assembly of F1-ATPase